MNFPTLSGSGFPHSEDKRAGKFKKKLYCSLPCFSIYPGSNNTSLLSTYWKKLVKFNFTNFFLMKYEHFEPPNDPLCLVGANLWASLTLGMYMLLYSTTSNHFQHHLSNYRKHKLCILMLIAVEKRYGIAYLSVHSDSIKNIY